MDLAIGAAQLQFPSVAADDVTFQELAAHQRKLLRQIPSAGTRRHQYPQESDDGSQLRFRGVAKCRHAQFGHSRTEHGGQLFVAAAPHLGQDAGGVLAAARVGAVAYGAAILECRGAVGSLRRRACQACRDGGEARESIQVFHEILNESYSKN